VTLFPFFSLPAWSNFFDKALFDWVTKHFWR
jgi:hypothetical protein